MHVCAVFSIQWVELRLLNVKICGNSLLFNICINWKSKIGQQSSIANLLEINLDMIESYFVTFDRYYDEFYISYNINKSVS